MEEIWKDIKGYEGIYQASNTGFIRSVDRLISRRGGYSPYWKRGCVLVSAPTPTCKYHTVKLSKEGNTRHFLVHVLIARTFYNNYDKELEVNHKDGNIFNNAISNLELITHVENIHHSIQNGFTTQKGECSVLSKLTNQDAKEIRKLWMTGVQQVQLARKYNVSKQTINNIVRNVCYIDKNYHPELHPKSNKYYKK